ncbi:hypothetical protein V5799_030233 [Amblyomma americanum]|uniref:Acyl-coa synthetase n=1 Tax=Amblyomma americanum TaxID=6943 RepID=A0AAQ4EPI2_AMBAM
MSSRVSLVIEDNVVKSCVEGTAIPDVDFVTYFTNVWRQYEDLVALVDVKTDVQYTFGELLDACRRVSAGLRRLGLRKGDVVAVHCANGTELVVAMCGTFFAGAVAALIKTSLAEGETRYELADSEAKFVFCDIELKEKIKNACDGLPSVEMIVVTTGPSDDGAHSLSELKLSPLEDNEVSLKPSVHTVLTVLYSSGSTGLPKGVQLTHRNVIAQVVSFGFLDPLVFERGDVFLPMTPILHVGGFSLFFGYIGHGCKVVLVPAPNYDVVLPAIQKHRPTMLGLLPTLIQKLDQHPLIGEVDTRSVKKLVTGGSTSSSRVLENIARRLGLKGVTQVYGMTELTGCITYSIPREDDFKSVGTPAPFVEMRVVDVCTRKALGPHEQGEICVKGACTFKGYLKNPNETADAYEDGFVRTGDVGYYTPDGRFYVCGRLKELIKCMDEQVAPAELEELLAADPGVRHAVVVGVPHPEYGEAARAFVVHRRRLQTGSLEEQREAQRLQELVAAHLAYHKHLHGGIEFLEIIPNTASGKDRRNALRDGYIYQQSCREKIPEVDKN